MSLLKKEVTVHRTPLISVIVPVYNSEKYLGQCLDSLTLQTYGNLEILCINDGSEDNSLNLLKKYSKEDSRIKIINQQNSGQSHARNKGLEVAKGEYISFVDSDDWISLTLYNKFIKALNASNGGFDTYMFNYTSYFERPHPNCFNNLSGINPERWQGKKPNHIYTSDDCTTPFSGNMGIWNKIYKKDLLTDNGFRFEEDYIFEDQLFYTQTFFESKGMYINFEVQYFYRQNEISTVHTLGGNAFDIFRILELMEEVLKKKDRFEKCKYELLQHKYHEYHAMIFKIITPLREKFYSSAKQNLIDSTKEGYDPNIIKNLFNSDIYFDMTSMEFEEFMKKHARH